MTISTPALLVLGTLAGAAFGGFAGVDAAGAAGLASATQCVDETYRWGGDVELGGSTPSAVTTYDTGVDVPTSTGTTLTVVGVSADGLDSAGFAHELAVHVGGMRATAGAAIAGGRVVVSAPSGASDSSIGAVRVVGATAVVRRCFVVASAAAPSTSSMSTSSTSTRSTTGGAIGPSSLPATGSDEWQHALVGAAAVAIGLGLVSAGRRRAHPA